MAKDQRGEAERLRDQVWAWLPAFHAVAELGTTVKAGAHLGLTAAAVSRSVRLLEDRVGQPLFHRVGRSLRLNEAGARLREATRVAVRAVTDGLRAIDPAALARPLRVASLGLLTEHFVVPALIDLEDDARVVAEHLNLRPVDGLAALRRQEVDACFYYEELAAEGLRVEDLGTTLKAVYCGRTHPLFAKKRVTRAEVCAQRFSVPQVGDSGRPMDGWPARYERRVGMRVTLLRSNLQVVLAGRFVAVLPEVVAAPYLASGDLRRLGQPPLDPIRLFVATRPEDADRADLRAVIDDVAARAAAGA